MPATIAAATGRTRKSGVRDSAAKRSDIPAATDPTMTARLRVSARRNQRRRVRRRCRKRTSSFGGALTGACRLICFGNWTLIMFDWTSRRLRDADVRKRERAAQLDNETRPPAVTDRGQNNAGAQVSRSAGAVLNFS